MKRTARALGPCVRFSRRSGAVVASAWDAPALRVVGAAALLRRRLLGHPIGCAWSSQQNHSQREGREGHDGGG